MDALVGLVPGLGSAMAAGGLAVFALVGLVVLVSLTGVFGGEKYEEPAQKVLAILFRRKDKAE